MTTYRVQSLSSAYGGSVPWDKAGTDYLGKSERNAITKYNRLYKWYHPEQSGWSGHVRIVGDDGWLYQPSFPIPGERSTLERVLHLDDISG